MAPMRFTYGASDKIKSVYDIDVDALTYLMLVAGKPVSSDWATNQDDLVMWADDPYCSISHEYLEWLPEQ